MRLTGRFRTRSGTDIYTHYNRIPASSQIFPDGIAGSVRSITCLSLPSADKGTHAPGTVFWWMAALTASGVRPVRLIPLPCQPPKDGTRGPKEFCASDL